MNTFYIRVKTTTVDGKVDSPFVLETVDCKDAIQLIYLIWDAFIWDENIFTVEWMIIERDKDENERVLSTLFSTSAQKYPARN